MTTKPTSVMRLGASQRGYHWTNQFQNLKLLVFNEVKNEMGKDLLMQRWSNQEVSTAE